MTEPAFRSIRPSSRQGHFRATFVLSLAVLFGVVAIPAAPARAQPQELRDTGSAEEQAAAHETGKRILEHFDNEDFAASWNDVGAHLRGILSEADWGPAIAKSRRDLGKLESRSLHSLGFTDHLEGAEPGRVGIVLFNSHFEQQEVAEKVVLALEEGEWKLSGYFVMRPKPAPDGAATGSESPSQKAD